MKNREPDELSAKLLTWRVSPRVPASFQREVWQRIAARQGERGLPIWTSLTQWFSMHFMRPQVALGIVLLSLSLSLGAAHFQARNTRMQHWKALENRYMASIDPLSIGR